MFRIDDGYLCETSNSCEFGQLNKYLKVVAVNFSPGDPIGLDQENFEFNQ